MNRFSATPFTVEWLTATSVAMTPPIDTLYHEYGSAYSPIGAVTKAVIAARPAALWWNTAVPTNVWKTGWVIYPVKNFPADKLTTVPISIADQKVGAKSYSL